MSWIHSLQDILTVLDEILPWLLPSLEAVEHSFPTPARLLVCLPLMACLILMRQRAEAAIAIPIERR